MAKLRTWLWAAALRDTHAATCPRELSASCHRNARKIRHWMPREGLGGWLSWKAEVGYKQDIQHEQVGCLGEEEGEERGRKKRRKQRRNERRDGRGTVGGGRTMKIKEEEEEAAMEGGEGKRSKGRLKWGRREERELNPTYSPVRTSLLNFPWDLPRSSQLGASPCMSNSTNPSLNL